MKGLWIMSKALPTPNEESHMICLFLFNLFYIMTAVFPLFPLLTFSMLSPSTHPLFLFRKSQSSHGYHQNMADQVVIRLSTSPCIQSGQSQFEKQVPKNQTEHKGHFLLPLLGVPLIDQSTQLSHIHRDDCNIYVNDLSQSHAGYLVVGSDYVNFYESIWLFLQVFL